jgi:hypothetical protein
MAAVTTPLRRKLALAAGLLCLGAPVLSSCGFDYATDRPNVIAHGGYQVEGDGMRVLAARIVASDDNHGVFVATIALNPTADPASDAASAPKLTDLSVRQGSDAQLTAKSFAPIAVSDTGAVNMADPSVGGIKVSGEFTAGDSIPVTLSFSDGSTISVQTPVVTQCGPYASIAPQGTSSESASSSTSASASASAETEPTAEPSAPYDCSTPSVPAIGE